MSGQSNTGLRIAMVTSELPPESKSGVGRQVARLAERLAHRGHRVQVKSFDPGEPECSFAVEQLWKPARQSADKAWRLMVAPFAFAVGTYRDSDVIHAHGDNPLLYRRKIPVIRTFYGSAREEARTAETLRRRFSQKLLSTSEQLGRRLARVTVGISENTRESIGGLDFIVPCGVDRQLFKPGPKSPHPSVLFVGTLSGRKRGRLVVEAFQKTILPEYESAELWLVTPTPIRGPGIRSFCKLTDEHIAKLFSAAWVFVLPSAYEGFGVPYIEAMASGTPVVATANSGAKELVRPETGGLISKDQNIGQVISELIANEARRSQLALRGRSFSRGFDWNLVAQRYEEIYRLALSAQNADP